MPEQTWTFVDRSTWPPGPWDAETVDKVQWKDQASGMTCLARRSHTGVWCGYVGLPPSHPLFMHDSHAVENFLDVHGGVNFSNFCDEDDPIEGICHVPEPGEPEQVWWLGFDCAHGWDVMPAYAAMWPQNLDDGPFRATYRTLDYVRTECANLAAQLAKVKAEAQHAE